MDESDRKRFQAIYLRFVERVDPIEMLGHITCLSDHTRDIIRNSQTCHNGSRNLAAQKLHEALKCRPDGLKQATYALRECKFEDLANEIGPQQASSRDLFQNPQRPHNLQAPYRNGAQNLPDGSPNYPNSYAMQSNQNPIPFQPYVPGRDKVPNFQNVNMPASLPVASNVGLPVPTWSMPQQPQQGVNPLQQHPYSQHQPDMRNAPSAHSASVSEFPNYPQGDQAVQNFGGKEPSMESLKMYGSTNTGMVIEQKNDLNISISDAKILNTVVSDTDNEDSDFDSTEKKKNEKEEKFSSLPDSDSSKMINDQSTLKNKEEKENVRMAEESFENAPAKPQATVFNSSETTLKSPQEHSQMPLEFDNQIGSAKNIDNNSARTGFDSSETTLKSPITDADQIDTSNAERTNKLSLRSKVVKNNFETEITQEHVENIRQKCFSNVYSQPNSQLPSGSLVSTERTINVEATQQPVDQSLEDARIPVMRCLVDDDERNSILRKGNKANALGIHSYSGGDGAEDGDSLYSYSGESRSAVNSGEDIISMDAIPTTKGNTVRADHPTDLTKDQTQNNNVQKSKTATSKGTGANNQTDNQQELIVVSTCTSDGNPTPSIQDPLLDTSAQSACAEREWMTSAKGQKQL